MAQSEACVIALFVACMIVSGTVNTLTTKMQFTTVSINKDGEEVPFSKPWFATLNMMSAMALVGLVDKCARLTRREEVMAPDDSSRPYSAMDDHGVKDESARSLSYTQKLIIVAIPAAFDLLATGFCCIGMLYLPASIWQMLKGGSIIFCGLFSVVFLKRQLYCFNWIGLTIVVSGLGLVGLSNLLGSSQDPNAKSVNEILIGIGFCMAGQVVQAAQVIAEEWLMKDVDLPAMQVVGWEGIWGTLMMLVVVYPTLWFLPGQDHGHMEDALDTFEMLKNSMKLSGLVVVYLCSCGCYNASGISVTSKLSATVRQMMDASRTCFIWLFGLIVHYCVDKDSAYGEAWTSWSILQLVGFLILVCGQGVYGEIIKLPGFYYPPVVEVDQTAFASPGALRVASPVPARKRGDSAGPIVLEWNST